MVEFLSRVALGRERGSDRALRLAQCSTRRQFRRSDGNGRRGDSNSGRDRFSRFALRAAARERRVEVGHLLPTIQPVFCDVLNDAIRNEVPNRRARTHTSPAIG